MASESLQNVVSEFSPNGEHFAYSDASGSLQIWETATRTKRQQYTPSAHLSETCSCLSWAPPRRTPSDQATPSKKRRRTIESNDKLELIALGTAKGTVLLYSRATNDLHSQLTGGHSDRVNDISWNQEDNRLFSCSSDKHIAEWSISKSSLRHKWKADDTAVHSVCICHTKRHLLSAGNSIKLWDIETYQVLQTFTGHASQVFRLIQVPNRSRHKSNDASDELSIAGGYVLSTSHDDHHISVWQISSTEQKATKKPIASFALPDNPVQLSISCQRHNKLHLSAVTSNGKLALFEHVLNGQSGVLKPELVVAMKTEDGERLPVRAALFSPDSDDSLVVAYSGRNLLVPQFETLRPKDLKLLKMDKKKEVCLVREKPLSTLVSQESALSKLKNPQVSGDVTVVRPSDAVVGARNKDEKQGPKRHLEATVEERLSAMGVVDPASSSADGRKRTPKTDNMATLLVQGLHSEDKNILNNVLQRSEAELITQTVKRLPLTAVVLLIKELKRRMSGHAQSALVSRKWLKCVLTQHASYLMTLPDREALLGELQQMLETRLDVFPKVCQLQGRLDLILSQIDSKKSSQEPWKTDPPQLVYKDESSDEENDIGDGINDDEMLCEDEDDWEQNDDGDEEVEMEDSSDDDDDNSGNNGDV